MLGAIAMMACGGTRLVRTVTCGELGDLETILITGYSAITGIGAIDDNRHQCRHGVFDIVEVALYSSLSGQSFTYILDEQNVPNDDGTFMSLIVAGTTLNRSDATYNGNALGRSSWTWFGGGLPTIPGSGTIPLHIWIP